MNVGDMAARMAPNPPQDDDEKRRAMTAAGWDISAYQGNDTWMLPIPATFVVAPDGVVKARFVDPDYRKRMAIEDILAAVRQIAN